MTIDNLEVEVTLLPHWEGAGVRRVFCKDGWDVSIGASSSHYCSPRGGNLHYYTQYELGFPSALDPTLAEYAESPDTVETVFGYVPVDVVQQILDSHGGVDRVRWHRGYEGSSAQLVAVMARTIQGTI